MGSCDTLQRHVKRWRALEGPAKTVLFAQEHRSGEIGVSDFTNMNALGITINREPFPHLLYHFTLTYSNWEAGISFTVCWPLIAANAHRRLQSRTMLLINLSHLTLLV